MNKEEKPNTNKKLTISSLSEEEISIANELARRSDKKVTRWASEVVRRAIQNRVYFEDKPLYIEEEGAVLINSESSDSDIPIETTERNPEMEEFVQKSFLLEKFFDNKLIRLSKLSKKTESEYMRKVIGDSVDKGLVYNSEEHSLA